MLWSCCSAAPRSGATAAPLHVAELAAAVPFSPDADQAVSDMSSNMLPTATAASSVLYYLEAAVGYNLVDVGPALDNVKTLLQHPVDPSSSAFVLHDLLL